MTSFSGPRSAPAAGDGAPAQLAGWRWPALRTRQGRLVAWNAEAEVLLAEHRPPAVGEWLVEWFADPTVAGLARLLLVPLPEPTVAVSLHLRAGARDDGGGTDCRVWVLEAPEGELWDREILFGQAPAADTLPAHLLEQDMRHRLFGVLENTPMAYWVVGSDGRMQYINAHFLRELLGLPFAAVQGHTLWELFPRELADEYHRNNQWVLATGRPIQTFEDALDREGKRRRYLVHKFAITLSDGSRAAAGCALEVTDWARAESDRRRHEATIRAAVRAGRIGSWYWDQAARRLELDDTCRELLDIQRRRDRGVRHLLRRLRPAERRALRGLLRYGAEAMVPFSREFRLTGPGSGGAMRFLLVRGEVVTDQQGALRGFAGVLIDLTDYRRALTQQRIAERAVDAASDGVVVLDGRGVVVYRNPGFEALTGLGNVSTAAEMPACYRWEGIEPEPIAHLWRPPVQPRRPAEIWFRHADGGLRPARLSLYPLDAEIPEAEPYCVALFTDLSQYKDIEQQLRYLANHDAVTGLLNKTAFSEHLRQALKGRREPDAAGVAVLFLDLDHFKRINDMHGHATGDDLLASACARLRGHLRPDDVMARFGGDEFVILLHGVSDAGEVASLAERLVHAFEEPFTIGGKRLYCSLSIGIAVAPLDGQEASLLLRHADVALYAAKEAGRGCARFFDRRANERALQTYALVSALQDAVRNDDFEIHFQPIVNLSDGSTHGVEALVRWRHPTEGLLLPSGFLATAESTGLIRQIGQRVLEAVLSRAAEWHRQGDKPRISLNLSADELGEPDLARRMAEQLERHGVPPDVLLVEVTESAMMRDTAQAVRTVRALREQGMRVAIDDFGTGYSSLAYLKDFPVDYLKIDRHFVQGAMTNDKDRAIVRAVLAMAGAMGLGVIAEGVESRQAWQLLGALGCRFGQGFWFAGPAPEVDWRRRYPAASP